ncbi:MAG: protein kinase [Myxococcota bacterium]|jgi:serine/threonine protein kinase|nr:protein kinase [Myxococcota bacterium]
MLLRDRYQLLDVFADSGGMGVIYRAIDQKCADNTVLIKATRYDGGGNARRFRYTRDEAVKHIEKARKILEWEKKVLVRFKNQSVGNIPSPNDFFYGPSILLQPSYQGKFDSYSLPPELLQTEPYLVLELIQGQPLDKLLHSQAFQANLELELLRIARELLSIFIKLHKSISVGHGSGYFIYQDLKPANILIGEAGYVCLIDMGGVTLRLGERTTEPTAGCITAGYAAPEAANGRETQIDQRFDLYTLGVSLWQCATRIDPQSLGSEFPEFPLAPLRQAPLSEACQRIIATALQRDPAKRYPSAAHMRKDVIAALEAAERRALTAPQHVEQREAAFAKA